MKRVTKILVFLLFLSPVFLMHSGVENGNIALIPESVDNSITSEAGWLSGWEYRKSHNISGSIGAGTNYQVQIIVHYNTGIDSGQDVYCSGQCRTDFGDIRFTSSDGITELDYWLESTEASINATFWVEVDDNLDTNQTIFVYFGNAIAEIISNGANTFPFFDDFEGSSLDLAKWSIEIPDGTATISDSVLTLAGNDGDFRIAIMSLASAFSPASIRFRGMLEATQTTPQWNHIAWSHNIWGPGTYQRAGIRSKYGVNQTYVANDNGVVGDVALPSQLYDTFHTFDVHRLTDSCELHSDDTLVEVGNNQPDDTSVPIVLYCRDDDYVLQCDWIFMRTIIDIEPAHGEWGSLESEPDDGLGWLSGWEFRKSHSIEGSLGAEYDYQVKIVVHNGTGVDSADEVYCNGYCLPNFGDIRFTDNDGITELDYWMEESQSDNATFWVEILDTLDYNQVIYVYFGNPDATDASDGECTFIAWDDFDDGYTLYDVPKTSRGWSIVNQGGDICRIENNPTGRSGMGLRYAEDGAGELNLHIFNIWDQTDHDIAVHFNFYWDIRDYQFYFNVYDIDDWYPTVTLLSQTSDYDWEYYTDDTWYEYQNGLEPNMDVWYELEQQTDMDDGLDTSLIIDGYEYQGANNEDAIDGFDCVRFAAHGDYVDDYYIDDFYVRKFVSSEPIHSVWGSLESALSINSPTTLTFEVSTIGHSVTWSAFSYHPYRYLGFVDDVLLTNSSWDGSDVQIACDGLDLGSHNFTLQIFNIFGDTLIRSITVMVEDTTSPVLSHPSDLNYTVGSQGNTIQWNMADLYPDTYEIYLGNELLRSGSWNSTGETVSVSVDGLPVGEYNFTLSASDENGNTASDIVTVTVTTTTTDQIDTVVIIIMIAGVVVVLIVGAIVCRRRP